MEKRGRYVVAALPRRTGSFLAEQLVAALRLNRPTATLTAIAGEHGESERNFRRYLRGMLMPLGKARRFARRLRTAHLDAVTTLERTARAHPRAAEATPLLERARRAFESGHGALDTALDECHEMVRLERSALLLRRTQPRTSEQAHALARARARYRALKRELRKIERVIREGAADAL